MSWLEFSPMLDLLILNATTGLAQQKNCVEFLPKCLNKKELFFRMKKHRDHVWEDYEATIAHLKAVVNVNDLKCILAKLNSSKKWRNSTVNCPLANEKEV